MSKSLLGEVDDDGQLFKDKIKDPLMWHKRKCIVENPGDEEALLNELAFTAQLLREDANTRYAWSHRQWVLQTLGRGYADEVGFCYEILNTNARNKLVWDQLCFATQKCIEKGWDVIRPSELSYALRFILRHPENEHPWSFLRCLYENQMESLAMNPRLNSSLVTLFERERYRANAVRVNYDVYQNNVHTQLYVSMNKRGCLFALDFVSDLMEHGYQPDKRIEDAIEALFQGSCSSASTFLERVRSILHSDGGGND